jgi:hypothetical protein
MSFVNSSVSLYPPVHAPAGFAAEFNGEARGHVRTINGLDLRAEFSGEISGHARLALITPEPVLNEIPADAFTSQHYDARLFDSTGAEIDITSFSVEAPRGAVGKIISVQVAKKDVSLITAAKKYTLQIGKRATARGAVTWYNVLQYAELDSRSFSRGWGANQPADTLSFGAINSLADKLNGYPVSNLIVFDPNRTTISSDDLERVFDTDGILVQTELRRVYGLNLYYLLSLLRKFTGFSSIQTNIPNFELSRADFTITESYRASIAGIIGAFEPVFYTVGDVLWILDKTAAIPDEFEPAAISPDTFSNWQMQMPSAQAIDGFLLSFVDSSSQANTYVDRLVQTSEETGRYGNPDYTRTEINQTFRDWKNTSNLNVVLRSEITREVRSIYNNLLQLIGRETETHTYDAQGKRTNTSRTVEAMVPDLHNDGTPALLTTRRETQTVFYTPDPKNTKRFFQNKTVTQTRGLIAIDSENQYLDEDFKQDFEKAHESGNLLLTMTTEFAPIETVTETLTPLGNNQYQVRVTTFDHLRGKTKNSISEPKTGDATLSGQAGRSRKLLVLREGLTQAARPGKAIENFAVGELPLYFAKPLARRMLARRLAKKQSGTIEIAGFDQSIERGVFFRVLDRNDASFGVFLSEGYSVSGTDLRTVNQKIITRIDCSEI